MPKSILAFLIAFLVPAAALSQPLAGKLVITGSSTMAPVVAELGRQFASLHPGVEITVEAGGSGRGASDALADKSDIGMVSRDLGAAEKTLFAIPMGRDGVVFIVHRDNPVRAITREQARSIFDGTVTDWSALGGAAGPILVTARPLGRGTMEVAPHFMGMAAESLKATRILGDNPEVIAFVGANPRAISFISIGAMDLAVEKGAPLKALSIAGLVPAVGAVRDGSWPMARPLNLVTKRVPKGLAQAFIRFVRSQEARAAIIRYDFVPYLS